MIVACQWNCDDCQPMEALSGSLDVGPANIRPFTSVTRDIRGSRLTRSSPTGPAEHDEGGSLRRYGQQTSIHNNHAHPRSFSAPFEINRGHRARSRLVTNLTKDEDPAPTLRPTKTVDVWESRTLSDRQMGDKNQRKGMAYRPRSVSSLLMRLRAMMCNVCACGCSRKKERKVWWR